MLLHALRSPLAVVASVTMAVGLRLYSVWKGTSLPRPHWISTGSHRAPTGEHDARTGGVGRPPAEPTLPSESTPPA